MFLGTGDFAAASYDSPGLPVPRPMEGLGYPAHGSQAPAAPHSLAPVAMSSFGEAGATGPQAAQPADPDPARSRPALKTGFAILLAGALIGGLSGVGVRARENATLASTRAQQAEKAAPGAPAPNTNAAPAATSPFAGVAFGSLVLPPPPAAAPAPIIATGTTATPAMKPQRPAAKAGGRSWVAKPKAKDDGYKIASANADEPKAKPAKEPKPAVKVAKAEAKKAAKEADDADKILKAAMGATENTL